MLYDKLKVRISPDRSSLGKASGYDVADRMKQLLGTQERIRMIFAAAPSQNEFLQTLTQIEGIDWKRVTVFHMDEYIGLSSDAPQRFSQFLKDRLFDVVSPGVVHLIDCSGEAQEECDRYAGLLSQSPIDIVCLGIGENGHIAFNDPPVADFNDPALVKLVALEGDCRQQQVNDGCFPVIADVPTHALTLTIPALLSGKHLFCMVPGPTKREAVSRTLHETIGTGCPSTILRTHPDCTLYVDADSYQERQRAR